MSDVFPTIVDTLLANNSKVEVLISLFITVIQFSYFPLDNIEQINLDCSQKSK